MGNKRLECEIFYIKTIENSVSKFFFFFFFLIEKLDSTSEREFMFFKHPSENLKLIF